jgi:hypothetical protein
MARENLIRIETCLVNGYTRATFHFRSAKPIGVTTKPLHSYDYMQQVEFKSLDPDGQNLITEVFGLSGIWEISTHYQSVTITAGKSYALAEFIPKVVAIIATLFYYEENMELDDVVIEYIGSTKSPPVECHFYETGQTQFDIDHIKQMKVL